MNLMSKVKKMNKVEAKMILPMLYETQYGIFDHVKESNKPMASVAYHDAYDTYTDSLFNDLVYRYEENGIHEVYHMTFLEYINLPKTVTLQLDEQARWVRQRRDKALKEAQAKTSQAINAEGKVPF